LGNEKLSQIALAELMAKIIEGFRMREGERILFDLQASSDALLVEGSEDRLIQVFENVLDNAISFSPAHGTIHIDVRPERTFAVLRIGDEGEGISEQHIGRIFDRFFTYRPATDQPRQRHTGLGLAIVKAIVEGYGGSIKASNAEKGALFEIRLPLSRSGR
ncbi:MAG TPA: ATP-binding protein, partial [Thermoanaerobaculia bacterium]|nr:ATP-binding protein [Thermoanaerobaculia bacterium]